MKRQLILETRDRERERGRQTEREKEIEANKVFLVTRFWYQRLDSSIFEIKIFLIVRVAGRIQSLSLKDILPLIHLQSCSYTLSKDLTF